MRRKAPSVRGGAGAGGFVLRTTLLVAMLGALGIFHIWSRTRVLATGYELGELQRAHARLTSEHDRLRLEVESLRSPATLERWARTKLEMAPPAPGTVRVAEPPVATAAAGRAGGDGVVHRAAPAEPAAPPRVERAGGRAAAGARAGTPGGVTARDAGVPGEQVALRGPLREPPPAAERGW
ncbi:MAG TPA: cell division protein FtsL [Anaeromyxobacteraceae bacterium]|nr:cell division protein FtsL [Anaeromyxobacteraceae bacterium]